MLRMIHSLDSGFANRRFAAYLLTPLRWNDGLGHSGIGNDSTHSRVDHRCLFERPISGSSFATHSQNGYP